jgi:hypothetical protein
MSAIGEVELQIGGGNGISQYAIGADGSLTPTATLAVATGPPPSSRSAERSSRGGFRATGMGIFMLKNTGENNDRES